eukprot:c25433_g1_i1 orf=219-470(+)
MDMKGIHFPLETSTKWQKPPSFQICQSKSLALPGVVTTLFSTGAVHHPSKHAIVLGWKIYPKISPHPEKVLYEPSPWYQTSYL